MGKSTITIEDLSTLLSIIDRSGKKKINKDINNFSNTINQLYQQVHTTRNSLSFRQGENDTTWKYVCQEFWVFRLKRNLSLDKEEWRILEVITKWLPWHQARKENDKTIKLPNKLMDINANILSKVLTNKI